MERRFSVSSLSLEQRVGTDPPYIVGYAAVYYRDDDPGTEYVLWDDEYGKCVERIMPGAFDQVLMPQIADGFDTAALFNHQPDHLLGRVSAGTLEMKSDPKGLRYAITPPDSPLAKGVIASIQRGDLKGSSFSFVVGKAGQKFITQGKFTVREIHKFDRLMDVGPVTFPAYGATTTGTRSDESRDEARKALQEYLRSAALGAGRRTEIEVRARCAALGL